MANYVKSTDFAAKDSLLTGDPLKIVSGTEIDDEYNAIQTAINSKANTNSPALTGSPTAPTATAGTNTTQIATTAFVTAAQTPLATILAAVYPVGSIYTNATNGTNPATLLGFGTWVGFGPGRVPVGFDASNPLFNALEKIGGLADASLVSHTHTATVDTHAGHQHGIIPENYTRFFGLDGGGTGVGWNAQSGDPGLTRLAGAHSHTVTNSAAGVSATNKNYQPYITVYMWKRTA